jgi:hypothetical protein
MRYKDDWDLFFWCNCDVDGRDYSYVTLTFNSNRTVTRRIADKDRVIEALNKRSDIDGVIAYVQYSITYDDVKIKETVNNYISTILNVPINYMGYEGKIKNVGEERYGFFKKGAKTKYYEVPDIAILAMSIL